ncbi:hypothetical protein FA15DRAFT_418337 [Coprinopsis marcescibilis]|uniref:Uncharacterized protein n=1 Tax=Coprinopsis marcescibilis TaxID=230819 RepID=A0A5C3KX58_COPMA|nr:hypothetical protein FA15DRAFT_418337 [Coprinopsis marcescibilis]
MPSAPPILAQFPPPAAQPQSSFVVGSDEGSYNDVIPQPVIPFVDGNIWYGPSDRSAELFDYSASRAPSVVSHHTFYSLDDQWPISDTVFDDFDLAANGTKDNYDTIDPISNAPFQFTVGEGPSRNMGAYDAALSYMDDPQVGLPDVGVQYWIDKLASNPPDSTPPTPLHYDTSPHSCYFQAADMVNVTVSPNATSPSGSTLDNGSIFDMNMFQGQGMTNPEQWDYGDCGSSLTAASEHYNA